MSSNLTASATPGACSSRRGYRFLIIRKFMSDSGDFLKQTAYTRNGVFHFPLTAMRGGTSTGVLIWGPHLAPYAQDREVIIRKIMGVPDQGELKGNRQITGLGRGPATSNKVFIIDRSDDPRADFVSTFAQLAADKSAIDWSVNCGNMSAAIPLFLLEYGLINPENPTTEVRILNSNTGVITDCRVPTPREGVHEISDTTIPGVNGAFPAVELSLRNPSGSNTQMLLPTGAVRDVFDGIEASCVDVAVPMVIMAAGALGLTGQESIAALGADAALKERLRSIWVQAGLKMKLKRKGGQFMTAAELAASESLPKVCLISTPTEDGHISARYFTPQEPHNSLAVTGGCCLATACLIPGTTAHAIASGLAPLGAEASEHLVAMENPAGILKARVFGQRLSDTEFEFPWVAYERSAQIFMNGFFRIHRYHDTH